MNYCMVPSNDYSNSISLLRGFTDKSDCEEEEEEEQEQEQ